ncbi:MAG: S-layer homology domain-containing protein [Clostridia bacterium]|nr:S-layer homology domain-containing protein [Clostridia bacterium]
MKKRILSVLLMATMLLASSVGSFAYSEDDILDKVGTVLDELNYDAVTEYGDWQKDKIYHAAQLDAIEAAYARIDAADIGEVVEAILVHEGLTVNQKLYLCALAKAQDDDAIAAVLNAYNTAGLSWKDSFDPLQDFSDHLGDNTALIAPPGAPADVEAEYVNVLADNAKKAVLASHLEEVFKDLLKVAFSSTGANLDYNYQLGIESKDITKKTLMVFASEVIEKEGIPFRTAASVSALVTAAKDYALSFKNDANIALAKAALDRVASAPYSNTISKAFDETATGITAVNNGYFAGKDVLVDLELIFGNGSDEGIVESLLMAVDPDFEATGMILNIALSKGIQLHRPFGRMQDIKENTASAGDFSNITLSHESSIDIKTEEYAVSDIELEPIALNTSWFDIEFYKENGSKLTGITYNDGQVFVTKNVARGVENAYMVLYRKDASGEEKTFIETYPVKVDFTDGITTSPGTSSTIRYTVTFNTNGGSEITPQRYARGTEVQLTMVPTKEGYIFDGWYSDAQLTNKIESIVVDENVTIYAGWKKDGSTVVSKVEIPELLEDKEHYAYVMGYPEGDIRPNGNITRAEAVTMIFRLLKDDVRKANLTVENKFEDVTADDWFNTAVSTLAKLGIIEGRTETTFVPNANITRAEFATMFARLAEYEFVAENNYSDVEHHWAKAFIEEVDAYGWIAGYEDDTFRPDNNITRAEAMTLINRVLQRVPENEDALLDGMTIWTDNADKTAWYYLAVQEATNSHEYEVKGTYEVWTKLNENKDWTTFEK